MLKFSDNPDSEDITERSYPEDSDNCIKASTQFQGYANRNIQNDKFNTLLKDNKVNSIYASHLINQILKDQHNYNQQQINIWENRPMSIDNCKFILISKAK